MATDGAFFGEAFFFGDAFLDGVDFFYGDALFGAFLAADGFDDLVFSFLIWAPVTLLFLTWTALVLFFTWATAFAIGKLIDYNFEAFPP